MGRTSAGRGRQTTPRGRLGLRPAGPAGHMELALILLAPFTVIISQLYSPRNTITLVPSPNWAIWYSWIVSPASSERDCHIHCFRRPPCPFLIDLDPLNNSRFDTFKTLYLWRTRKDTETREERERQAMGYQQPAGTR